DIVRRVFLGFCPERPRIIRFQSEHGENGPEVDVGTDERIEDTASLGVIAPDVSWANRGTMESVSAPIRHLRRSRFLVQSPISVQAFRASQSSGIGRVEWIITEDYLGTVHDTIAVAILVEGIR